MPASLPVSTDELEREFSTLQTRALDVRRYL